MEMGLFAQALFTGLGCLMAVTYIWRGIVTVVQRFITTKTKDERLRSGGQAPRFAGRWTGL